MIVLNLICSAGHRFDGWFASCDAFDDQAGKQLVSCPHCNVTGVRRLPSTPHVAKSAGMPTVPDNGEAEMIAFIDQLRHLADSSEDVGEQFPGEARRIHYHDSPERRIRGLATLDETRELMDEGILILPVPPKKRETH